jgi:hypothetical protein
MSEALYFCPTEINGRIVITVPKIFFIIVIMIF